MKSARHLLFEDTSSDSKEKAKKDNNRNDIEQIKADNTIIKIFEGIASKEEDPLDKKDKK